MKSSSGKWTMTTTVLLTVAALTTACGHNAPREPARSVQPSLPLPTSGSASVSQSGWTSSPIPDDPATIDPTSETLLNPDPAATISCGAPNFCQAVSDDGYVWSWNGRAWSGPTAVDPISSIDNIGFDIACTADHFCMLVNKTDAFVYRDGAWSRSTTDWGGNFYGLVACASSKLCIVAGGPGNEDAYVNGRWAGQSNVDASAGAGAIACASGTTTCYVVDANNAVVKYAAGTWTLGSVIFDPGPADNTVLVQALSCASAIVCAAMDADDRVWFKQGARWRQTDTGLDQEDAQVLACGSIAFCLAYDHGSFSTWNGSSWTNGGNLSAGSFADDTDISCPSDNSCVGVTIGNNPGLVYRGPNSEG
jgi:hypothetical protein